MVNSKKFVNNKKLDEQLVILRQGYRNRISKKETLAYMLTFPAQCCPFVLVNKDPNSHDGFVVTCGTYSLAKGIPIAPTFLVVSPILIFATNAVVRMVEDRHDTRYFHVTGSPENEFRIVADDSIDMVRTRMDSFDLTHLTPDFRQMGYYRVSGSVIGAYYNRFESQLWLVRF